MKSNLRAPIEPSGQRQAGLSTLHLVTFQDAADLKLALNRGAVPTDFECKLNRLSTQSLLHRSVEHNCRVFIALLQAAHQGLFNQAMAAEKERLLRVLAYVRKDDDAIPDYKPNGFADDQREVRAAVAELAGLLNSFKAWRLCYQVPGLWTQAAPNPTATA